MTTAGVCLRIELLRKRSGSFDLFQIIPERRGDGAFCADLVGAFPQKVPAFLRQREQKARHLPLDMGEQVFCRVKGTDAKRRKVLEAMEEGQTPDIVLTESETAMSALGELSGRSVREDVTNRIFARFCVGK